MKLYHKLNLNEDLVQRIKDAALGDMKSINLANGQMHFLKEPALCLNEFLSSELLPRVYNCILFHRPGGVQQPIHNDCNNKNPPETISCAINIPLINCEDSYMEWFEGDYSTKISEALGKDGITRRYVDLDWNTPPKVIDRIVIDAPYLVRVSVPHRVTITNKPRSLITLRFEGNPSFETIHQLFLEANLLEASTSLL